MIDQMVSYNRNTGPSMGASVLGDSNERSRVQGAIVQSVVSASPISSMHHGHGSRLDEKDRKPIWRAGVRGPPGAVTPC